MSTNTTNYGWLLPDDGSIGWGSSLRTFISDVDDKLYNRVNLQGSTPGTAQTGHSNISGTAKSGSVETGALSAGAITGAGLAAITRTSEQLRLLYDVSNYASFTVSSGGDLTVAPTGGDTSVTGTLAVSGALTVNGSGDSAFTAGRLLVTKTSEQLRLRYDASNYLAAAVASDGSTTVTTATGSTGGNLTLQPAGDLIVDPTGNDILPTTGYDLNLGSLTKKFLTLHAAELWVETLVAQNTIATIGGRVLVGPTTQLVADLGSGAGATTINVKHNNLANGDRIYMEANGSVEFMAVTSAASGSAGNYSYSVTRDLDGSGRNAWSAGDAVFNTGQTGSGWIDLYSVRGVKSSSEIGPSIVMNVRGSSTYNDWSARAAMGNLNGLYGYATDVYGFAAGRYGAASHTWITVDETNGLRIGNNTTTKLQAKTNGDLDLTGNLDVTGTIYAANRKISINATAIDTTVGTSSGNFNFLRFYNATPALVGQWQAYESSGNVTSEHLFQPATKNHSALVQMVATGLDNAGTPNQHNAVLALTGGTASATVSLYGSSPGNTAGLYLNAANSTGQLSASGTFYLTVNDTAQTTWPLAVTGAGVFSGALTVGAAASATSGYMLDVRGKVLTNDVVTLSGQPDAMAYNSGAQTIGTATWTTLTFDSEAWDVGSTHSTSSNTGRLTVPTGAAGKYLVVGQVAFASNATGFRAIRILVNGATAYFGPEVPAVNGDGTILNFCQPFNMSAGDYVELQCYQNSGGNLNTTAGASATWFSFGKRA